MWAFIEEVFWHLFCIILFSVVMFNDEIALIQSYFCNKVTVIDCPLDIPSVNERKELELQPLHLVLHVTQNLRRNNSCVSFPTHTFLWDRCHSDALLWATSLISPGLCDCRSPWWSLYGSFEKTLFISVFDFYRLTLLQDTHRSHLREYERRIQDVKSSKSTIQNLENSSNQALTFKFYKSMKIYVENLIDCLNEKVYGYKCLYHISFSFYAEIPLPCDLQKA